MPSKIARAQKEADILAALKYRSGPDSCNSLYAGSLQTSMVIQALGGSYGRDGAADLLPKATDKMVNEAYKCLRNLIEYMKVHPAYKPFHKCQDALERLREAESFIGSPVNHLFMDDLSPDHRKNWLRSVREILTANGIEPENLAGPWRTSPGI